MGVVYLADDTDLQRQVALKLPTFAAGESPQRAERFLREARATAGLSTPNICTVFDLGSQDGWCCSSSSPAGRRTAGLSAW